MTIISPEQRRFLGRQRVVRLATVDRESMPHVVPVCFALVGETVYIVLDEKPKRVGAHALKRVRNILATPKAALVADHYDDTDWSRLGWVLLRGRAKIIEEGAEYAAALDRLRDRYRQYREMDLDGRPMIALRVEKATHWGDLGLRGA